MAKKILYFVFPFAVFITCNILLNPLLRRILDPMERAIASAFVGLFLFTGLTILIYKLAEFANIAKPKLGKFKFLIVGMLVGIVLSFAAGISFSYVNEKTIDWSHFSKDIQLSSVSQISHAMNEESVFRLGIVSGAASLAGTWSGIMAGSLPFGILHLIDRFLGVPVDIQQVLGIIVAGVLLSLLYLRLGLWAAIGCHYTWNALSIFWVNAMELEKTSGVTALEGAWTTTILTLVLIIPMIRRPETPVWWRRSKAERSAVRNDGLTAYQ